MWGAFRGVGLNLTTGFCFSPRAKLNSFGNKEKLLERAGFRGEIRIFLPET
jgi:hypothetical protein